MPEREVNCDKFDTCRIKGEEAVLSVCCDYVFDAHGNSISCNGAPWHQYCAFYKLPDDVRMRERVLATKPRSLFDISK